MYHSSDWQAVAGLTECVGEWVGEIWLSDKSVCLVNYNHDNVEVWCFITRRRLFMIV